MAFESPLEFRLYTVNDILQFKILDFQETFASLRLADLPLQCRGDAHDFDPSQVLKYYVQVGSKQLQLNLRLTFDQLLLNKKLAQ